MQLQQDYQEKLLATRSHSAHVEPIIPHTVNRDDWFDVLALFEASLGNDQASKLYAVLFDKGADFPANLYLDEEDYQFFIHKSRSLLAIYAETDHEAWVELGLQHVLCRRSHVDHDKATFFLKKAIAANIPVAEPLFLYYNCLGILKDYTKEEARGALKLLADEGNLWAIAYFSHLEVWTDNFNDVFQNIQVLKGQPESKLRRHYYESLQFYYARIGEQEKRAQTLTAGISDTDSTYCKFLSTEQKRAHASSADELALLIPEYLEVFETGITDASVQIALIKLGGLPQEGQTAEQYQDAIFYLEKAWLYNNAYAGYRLACLYLYAEPVLDIEQGLEILEAAAEKQQSVDAEIELAEIYLEGRLAAFDEDKSLQIFQRLADNNIPYAQLRLGNFFEYGNADRAADYGAAFALYAKAAEAKLPQAIYQVGRFLKYGVHNQQPDLQAALPYFEEAASFDNAAAITELGLAQETQATANYALAFQYFERAAQLDYPYAHYLMGMYLEHDYQNSGEKRPHDAFLCYQKGADRHDLCSIYELARCYRFAVGVEGDLDKAIALYRQAADRNHAQALTDLALCYEYGYAVAQDSAQAEAFIIRAVDLGYPYAFYVLGRYYLHGLVEQRVEEGIQLLERAAEENIAEAMLLLGDYYFFDYDQIGEYDKGFTYYNNAEKLGYITDGIGMCYEFGVGVEPDSTKAFHYYKDAAARGNDGAIYRLGRCYYFGVGSEENKEEAFRCFDESAQNGNVYSRYFAGLQLLTADGVAANTEQGIAWITDAAEADYNEAQFRLGNCYLMGEGVEESEDQALLWFERAADNGHEQAIRLTKRSRR